MLMTLLAASAWASPTYPGELATDLAMPCSPTCTVCHDSNSGGAGTVVTDFGTAMMDRGLTGGSNTTALADALDAMTADAVDSDGDGTIDTEELAAGDDPNPDASPFCDLVTPEYGCSATGGGGVGALGVILGLMAVRRRR